MNTKLYGGNLVKLCSLGSGKQILGSGPYQYYIYETLENDKIVFDGLQSFTLYLLEKPDSASVNVLDVTDPMMQGDRVQAEGVSAVVMVRGGGCQVLDLWNK